MELPSWAANDEAPVGCWDDGKERGEGYRLGQVHTSIVFLHWSQAWLLETRALAVLVPIAAVSSPDLTEL